VSLAHLEALAPASQDLLGRLASRPWAEELYLAGSAALALHIGHRPVRDLDLMGGTNRLNGPERRDLLADLLALDPQTQVETARDGYLYSRMGGVGVRFFYYPYPLIEPVEEESGLAVAGLTDLGLMKLAAIISRASRRDFVDLFLLCRELPLETLLERAPDKFGHVRDFPLQALKGLADLSQIEGEPMPPMPPTPPTPPTPRLARPLEWETVEAWLGEEVRRLGRERVGLPGA
jgi:hypothetical protein